MVLWVMSKFDLLICIWALLGCSKVALAGHEAFEQLLTNGPIQLKAQPSCEPYQLAETPTVDSTTLAQDLAWVLADMSGKPMDTESACELDRQGRKMCKVVFSISEGELEWARIYQFESVSGNNSKIRLKDLRCFNIP